MSDFNSVAVFHCGAQVGSAWACAEGITLTLNAMGYSVIDCGRPEHRRVSIDQLRQVDLIILSAPEWYFENLMPIFGTEWFELAATKVAWFAESAHRDDRDFPMRDVLKLVDHGYFPAIQDAMEFSGTWLPFGVDTKIFKPLPVPKRFDVSFLGSMYPKRMDYVKKIGYPITHIQSVSDADIVKSFVFLAQAYNSTKIFVNLPALSRLLVTKVTEVMACKTMLVTPKLDHESGVKNLLQFEHGNHLVYYNPERPEELGGILDYYLNCPDEIIRIANSGFEEVVNKYDLSVQLGKLIEDAGSRKLM